MRKNTSSSLNRRAFLKAGAAMTLLAASSSAVLAQTPDFSKLGLRRSFSPEAAALTSQAGSDVTAPLQALINAAATAGEPLLLPAGRYKVSTLNLPSNAQLIGVPNLTILEASGADPVLQASDVSHIRLEGLSLDGKGTSGSGEGYKGLALFKAASNLTIEDCSFFNGASCGLYLERSSGEVVRSSFTNLLDVAIFSVEGNALNILDNRVSDCGNGGILVHRWSKGYDGAQVRGNRISNIRADAGGTGQNGNGINAYLADGVMVSNNIIRDCAFSAIRGNSSSNFQVLGNQCLASGEVAIFCEFAFEGAVISQNLVDGAALGISVANLDQGGHLAVVSSNVVRNIKGTGPYPLGETAFGTGISVEADASVTGNTIEDVARVGMLLGWGPFLRNVVASQNILRGTPIGFNVSVAEGAGDVIIAQNIIEGASEGAVLGYRWNERATDDLTKKGASEWPHLTVTDNRVVRATS
ncbi:TIGR03808 family TAT-translocated repetitive protein [Rhodobacteraceae bacterium RKSG542]|uniref:TIGR03808 family TAT-translocated repetitive protein n=1 Tax=Pseudovibrio flavus TaxID=2529854 RepID=UPI0012BBAF67|nr:TIGR03808 family TAT-translocated repetitive protein [Pseudovibrio flavus]MTI18916.1 TIGR03808 family TAT-translocated repetitive protein [Pseudovibrio flavus]